MHVCIVNSHPATFLNEPTIPEEQAVELHIRTGWVLLIEQWGRQMQLF